jgi:hypothetical protein
MGGTVVDHANLDEPDPTRSERKEVVIAFDPATASLTTR